MKNSLKPLLWITVPLALLGGVIYSQSRSGPAEPITGVDSVAAPVPPIPNGGPTEPRSHLVVLLDASASFHTADQTSQLRAAIPLVNRLVATFQENDYWPGPTRILIGTIRSASLNQAPLCDLLTSATESPFAVADTAGSRQEVEKCTEKLADIPVEPYTDISGSLFYASLVLHGIEHAPRGVLLVTDLAEDQPEGHTAATPDLRGLCVGSVIVIGPKDPARQTPSVLSSRISDWDKRIRGWGAKGFSYWHRDGVQPSALGTFYRDCGRR
jgi:hypothetical protein